MTTILKIKTERDLSKSQAVTETEKEPLSYKGRFYKGKNEEKEEDKTRDKNIKERKNVKL